MKARLFLFYFVLVFSVSYAQHQKTVWTANMNTIGLTRKISLLADLQYRASDKLKSTQTIILRPAINFHLTSSLTLTAGYAYIPSRRNISDGSSLLFPEQRLWQQIMLSKKFDEVQLVNRLRFEERFIPVVESADEKMEQDLTYRLRYFTRTVIPVDKDTTFIKGLFFALQNELFLNVAKTSVVNGKIFDQNRAYLAVGYRLKKVDLELGYMNQSVSLRKGNIYNHILQAIIYTRI